MWYVYEENGKFVYSRDEPGVQYITVNRISPIPQKPEYMPVLQADFETGNVWWELERVTPAKAVDSTDEWDEMAEAITEGVNSI